jgi:PAS domain S-box-containing protein
MVSHLDDTGGCLCEPLESVDGLRGQQQALIALRKSEALFRSLYESSGEAIMVRRPDRTLLIANPAAVALFGCKDESELARLTPLGLSPEFQPDGLPSVEKARQFSDAALKGEPQSFEWQYQLQDGQTIPTVVLLTRVDIEGESFMQVVIHDITQQKRMEEALRASDDRYRQLVDRTDMGFLVIDESGTVVESNEPYLRLIGATSMDEVIGHSVFEWTAPEEYASNTAAVARCSQQGYIQDFETVYLRLDGSRYHILINAIVRETTGGKRLVSLCRNITERRRAEEALQNSEVKYKTLYDASSDAILLRTMDRRIVGANRATLELFAYDTEDEMKSLDPADLYTERQPDGQLSSEKAPSMAEIAFREGSYSFEWRYKRKNGSEFLANVLWTRMELEGKPILLTTIRDITEQRRAEEALRENQQKLQAVLAQTYEFIGVLSLDGIVEEANRAALAFSGIEESSVLGKPFWDTPWWTHSPELRQELKKWIAEAACGAFIRKEVTHSDPQGNLHCIDFSLKPVKNDDGEVVFIIPEGRDITDRKQMEDELLKAKEAAETATEVKSNFLASMSHEIRTPMTAILGYADMLMDPKINASTQNNYAAVIHRNGEHLLALINDILDLSKIEAGKLAIDIRRCSVVSLLADVASVVRPRAEQHGISLTVEYRTEMPETILTDGNRLRQAIINLAGNAVKFTEQGSVRIVASFLSDGGNGKPAVQIQVVDTGIGIHEEALPNLFKPFSQADSTVFRKYGGTGLGLAISRQIAQMLGGNLTVTSTFGKGSTFTLTASTGDLDGVGMLKSPAETVLDVARQSSLTQPAMLEGVRVLLAEDGFDNRRLIEMVLRKAGANITSVENGRLAVEKAMAELFDVILMDINMPEMDGYEATRLLRSRGYDRPILALTANAMAGDSDKCREAGCNEHLAKPIDRVQLVHSVATFAGRLIDEHVGHEPTSSTACDVPSDDDVVVSQYADDPDFATVLAGFMARLEPQLDAMYNAFADQRFDELRRQAHRLRGSGGSYGFPTLTDAAKILEDAAKAQDMAAVHAALNAVDGSIRAVLRGGCSAVASATEKEQ